ncbi:hypothetical protein B0H66DRAFT_472835 [Apodospora peruviana]|uniref:RRM domain-containing protein n=1 Tax=Apodospora peruviana TaxID=516989 RepID=A0AAE0IAW3_9PEZI|nr:hypothetical protein B0H66DRAFT_472835 [Apodospora peruviana]
MESKQDAPEISDTIVVGGDYSDESPEESDDSLDAYGEDDEGQEQKNDPESGNDDYAMTFDSPAAGQGQDQDQSEADQAQSDVSRDSESMNSSSTPATPAPMKSQSPVAPTSILPSAPGTPPATGSFQGPPAPSDELSVSVSVPVSESPSESPAALPNASPSPTPATASATTAPEGLVDASGSAPITVSSHASPPAPTVAAGNEDDGGVDIIQKLVDNITAKAEAEAPASSSASPIQATPRTSPALLSSLNLSHSASLPPKPAVSQQPSHASSIPQPHSFQPRASHGIAPPNTNPAAPRGSYLSSGAPGTTSEAISSLPPPPPTSFNASQGSLHGLSPTSHHMPVSGDAVARQREWEAYVADEKRYTAEAKWERFPEGSRIFIVGNLSSERVSKREVFDVFHAFGRLAQISLKSAFGFVQYHTTEEGAVALHNAQGIELGGRKIHLEVSKNKKKDEFNRSPDRRNQRTGRGVDRYDGRDPNWRRDDYRPTRSPSPRRNDLRGSRDGFYPRGREPGAAFDRRRSRSPPRFPKHESKPYRRRSPSPPRRPPTDSDHLDIPRRYGNDVPDVQLLLLQEVDRDFVSWVQRPFHERGLRTDVMFVSPRLPREALVERQVLEGVHAIIDLDYAAQMQGRLSIQVFSRSGGSNVRFESYQNIDPTIAAELVVREKSQSAAAQVAQPARPVYPQNNYNPTYSTDPSTGYPYQYPHASAPSAQPQPAVPAPDLASMVGQLDNAALQALLSTLQTTQGAPAHQASHPVLLGGAPQAPQIDINTLLGNLRNVATSQPVPMAGAAPGVPGYGAPQYMPPTAGVNNAAMVQNIMEQLKRVAQ